jgi:hypothetical protein
MTCPGAVYRPDGATRRLLFMSTPHDLPPAVAAYIDATNQFDLERLVGTFESDALVNDHRQEFVGIAAIRDWAAREIVGDRVTLRPVGSRVCGHGVAVTAEVDGNFDKSRLPSPLVLAFYFSVNAGRIAQLVIVHNARPLPVEGT